MLYFKCANIIIKLRFISLITGKKRAKDFLTCELNSTSENET